MGRGSSKLKGIPYGSEFTTVYKSGNIKFVRTNSGAPTAPQYTQTKGRVYVSINSNDEVGAIVYFDKNNNRYKQIDVDGVPHKIKNERKSTHTHLGYYHDEKGTRDLTPKEEKMVERIKKTWYYYKSNR